jgi:hypothetical protein
MHTGMRKGAMLGLRWCDIDLDGAVAHICRNVVWLKGASRSRIPNGHPPLFPQRSAEGVGRNEAGRGCSHSPLTFAVYGGGEGQEAASVLAHLPVTVPSLLRRSALAEG